jgi:hypothetical protein
MRTVTAVVIQRSGPAVRAALAEHAPEDVARFEHEMRESLHHAAKDFDLGGVHRVLARWHASATMAANALTGEESAALQRARAGDVAGLHARDEHGAWTVLA